MRRGKGTTGYSAAMSPLLLPIRPLLMMFAGWVNRHQLDVIEYLQEENRLLKKRLGGRRLRFTDSERRRLARKAYAVGRKVLQELETLVTPDTLMSWYRRLVALKWTSAHRRSPGRPRTRQALVDLILRLARENPSWGYTRLQGALANLHHEVGRGTIAVILKEHGIEPAPERGKRTPWSTFLKSHWQTLAATDFFSVEVCTLRGFVTYYVLFFIDVATRSVHIAGITSSPNEFWMMQMARNLTDPEAGFLRGKSHLIMDRDTKYTEAFRRTLEREGVKVVRLPIRSPNLNSYAERFVRSIKEESLNRMMFFSEAQLRYVISQYMAHYHGERNHQGLQNTLIRGKEIVSSSRQLDSGPVERRRRLGGLLNFYYRNVA